LKIKTDIVRSRFFSQYTSVNLLFFDSSTDGLDVKPVLALFNNTCAANGNALCPATLPLVFAIGNGVMNPQSVLLGKLLGVRKSATVPSGETGIIESEAF
jgi:hypothetical protein